MALAITDVFAYYRFENDVLDSGPNGKDGTAIGSPTYAAAKFGQGISLTRGSSQRVEIDASHVAELNTYTINLWFKTTDTGESTLWSNGNSASDNAYSRVSIGAPTAGKIYWEFRDNTGSTLGSITSASTYNDGNLHVLRLERISAGSWEMFVDGVSVGTSSQSLSTSTIDRGAVGALVRTTEIIYATAVIDEVVVLNRAPTSAERTYLNTFEVYQTVTSQTITGKTRIQKAVSQTITGVADILRTVLQTITGKSRIMTVVSQTLSGKANIAGGSSLKTITGVARIQKSVVRILTGLSRIQKTTVHTLLGKSFIQYLATHTITGKARINKTVKQTITGVARIQKSITKQSSLPFDKSIGYAAKYSSRGNTFNPAPVAGNIFEPKYPPQSFEP